MARDIPLSPIEHATVHYESWLAKNTAVIRSDLTRKHFKISGDPFVFLRGTFYRWLQVWPVVCSTDLDAPRVAAVGDLHIENFGTWRDCEGRLIWGVNDFDEACALPYTNDLIRLATSALLAIQTEHLSISRDAAIGGILTGYVRGVQQGGRPYVLEGDHHVLRRLALAALDDPRTFWPNLNRGQAIRGALPKGARKALEALLPKPVQPYELRRRVAGVGSLGRARFVALTHLGGAPVAREAKARVPPASVWAGTPKATPAPEAVLHAVRVSDPFFEIRRRWVVRRLSPDCNKIDLGTLRDRDDQLELLHAMGWETANVHLGSAPPQRLLRDLRRRGGSWLHHAADRMAAETRAEWHRWRRYLRHRARP